MAKRTTATPEPLWSVVTDQPIEHVTLAAETGTVAFATSDHSIHIVDRRGQTTARWDRDAPITALQLSDDGRAVVVLDASNQVRWCDRRGREHWRRTASETARAIAVDSTAWYVAVADRDARVEVLDRHGGAISRFPSPSPLAALAFSRDRPCCFGCAKSGVVAAFEIDGRLSWQTRLESPAKDLALGGAVLAVHVTTDFGLESLDNRGRVERRLGVNPAVARLAAAPVRDACLVVTTAGRASLLNADGESCWDIAPVSPAAAALDPLVRRAWLLVEPNRLACFSLDSALGGSSDHDR